MTDPADQPAAPSPAEAGDTPEAAAPSAEAGGTPEAGTPGPGSPLYKGAPLDADRGPGLGCFWVQVVLLGFLLVFTPLTVIWAWDPAVSAGLLILTLFLLLFAGQTVIFLLRLVAADRRTRRRPLSAEARKTVGQLEEEARTAAAESADGAADADARPAGKDDAPPDGGARQA